MKESCSAGLCIVTGFALIVESAMSSLDAVARQSVCCASLNVFLWGMSRGRMVSLQRWKATLSQQTQCCSWTGEMTTLQRLQKCKRATGILHCICMLTCIIPCCRNNTCFTALMPNMWGCPVSMSQHLHDTSSYPGLWRSFFAASCRHSCMQCPSPRLASSWRRHLL